MKKNLVKYAFKILRLCHGGHFDHYGPGCRRDLLEKPASWSRPDRPRVLTEVVTDLETSYQRVTQEGRSLVENPAKLEGVYRYFTLSPSEYETWRLNAQFLPISNCPYIRILTASIWVIKTSRASMSPVWLQDGICLYSAIEGGKQVSADHYKAPATAIPVPLTDPTTGAGVRIAYMTLDQEILTAAIDNARGDLPVAVRIFTPFGKEMYHEGIRGNQRC